MHSASIPFEEQNVEAYRLLLRIEVGLRELIREAYEQEYGAGWQKRIPGEFRKKISASQTSEEQPRFDFARLGPFYYLTLGELCEIMKQSAGKVALAQLGGESFIDQLNSLFGPRNAVAHSRGVSAAGLAAIRSIYLQFETAVTPARLAELTRSPSIGIRPSEARLPLAKWMEEVLTALKAVAVSCPVEPTYELCRQQFWWGDEDLAGFATDGVNQVASIVRHYNMLPTGVGSATEKNRYITSHNCCSIVENAIAVLT